MTWMGRRWALDVLLAGAGLALAGLILHEALQTAWPALGAASDATRIERDPLDLPALRARGLRLDRQGRADRAEGILGFVGRRTWRDGPTEAWLWRRRLAEGRLTEALAIADALLREDAAGDLRPALFPALVRAAGYVEARPALEARLAAMPGWRTDFLRELAAQGDPDATRGVFSALAGGGASPTPAEYAPFIDRLVGVRDYASALAAWTEIARGAGSSLGGIRDGDFSGAPDGTAFSWRPADGVGGSSEARPAPDDPGIRALRVDYDGYSMPVLPAQLLVLPPGRYRVTWRERLDPAGAQSLFWRLRCADSDQVLARAPPAPAGQPGWRGVTMDVRTPAVGCAGQWLELTAAPGERRDPVTAWYETFRLTQPSNPAGPG